VPDTQSTSKIACPHVSIGHTPHHPQAAHVTCPNALMICAWTALGLLAAATVEDALAAGCDGDAPGAGTRDKQARNSSMGRPSDDADLNTLIATGCTLTAVVAVSTCRVHPPLYTVPDAPAQ
jgi:hypothetical protein